MTREKMKLYGDPEELREILQRVLRGRKFRLDCGHHITFNHNLGSDITIRNGKRLKVVCSQCGY
ncbi:MAG: hypothetical protein ABIK28_19965 [Planctomycetota bacterium]